MTEAVVADGRGGGREVRHRQQVGTYRDLVEPMVLATSEKVALNTHRHTLDAAAEALDDLVPGRITGRAILVPSARRDGHPWLLSRCRPSRRGCTRRAMRRRSTVSLRVR